MKISIAGYYGFGNVGDEAILESIVADIRREFPDSELDIIGDEYNTTLSGEGVRLVRWTDWLNVIESVRTSEWVIIGGGGLFNSYLDYTESAFLRGSRNFAAFIFGLPALAAMLGRRSFIYGVGASRFLSPVAYRHATMAIALADECTVRDRASRAIVSRSPRDRFRIRVYPDPAFRLRNADVPREALRRAGIAAGKPVVAVTLRNWLFADAESGEWEASIAAVLDEFASRHDVQLLFIPFQASEDAGSDLSNDPALIARMRDRLGRERTAELPHGLPSGEISAVLRESDLVVTMRLHGAILSIKNGTPFVALNYDPKVKNVVSGHRLGRFVTPLPGTEAEREVLAKLLEETWSARASIRLELTATAERLAQKAKGHVKRLVAAANRPRGRWRNRRALEFLAEIAGEQTLRLAEAEAERSRAEEETAGLREAITTLVNAGLTEAALRACESWRPRDQGGRAMRSYYLAYCLHLLGRPPEAAKEHYAAALQLGFDEFWVRYHRGQLHAALGERDLAFADLRRAQELRPDATLAQLLHDLRLTEEGLAPANTEAEETAERHG